MRPVPSAVYEAVPFAWAAIAARSLFPILSVWFFRLYRLNWQALSFYPVQIDSWEQPSPAPTRGETVSRQQPWPITILWAMQRAQTPPKRWTLTWLRRQPSWPPFPPMISTISAIHVAVVSWDPTSPLPLTWPSPRPTSTARANRWKHHPPDSMTPSPRLRPLALIPPKRLPTRPSYPLPQPHLHRPPYLTVQPHPTHMAEPTCHYNLQRAQR